MMEQQYLLRVEHEEYVKRMEDEHRHIDSRISKLEKSFEQFNEIANAVTKLASNMEIMCKEQERQRKAIEAIEGRDGELWRKVVAYAATAITGIVIGAIFTQFGL